MKWSIAIVLPVFEDWESLLRLAGDIDARLSESGMAAELSLRLMVVDDGSVQRLGAEALAGRRFSVIERIDVVRLVTNLGHQRAIAIGLVQALAHSRPDAVMVMDADGEDRAEDVVRLIEEHRKDPGTVLVAERAERSEGVLFRLGYLFYRVIYRMLTGTSIRFGNFSILSAAAVERLSHDADLWNHFAASIAKSRLTIRSIKVKRGTRYAGKSRMSYTSLVIHGLSAMSVHIDKIAARLISAAALTTLAALVAIAVVVGIRMGTALAIPGWASQLVGAFSIIALQGVTAATVLAFLALHGRRGASFFPVRDSARYVEGTSSVWARS